MGDLNADPFDGEQQLRQNDGEQRGPDDADHGSTDGPHHLGLPRALLVAIPQGGRHGSLWPHQTFDLRGEIRWEISGAGVHRRRLGAARAACYTAPRRGWR